MYERRKHAAKVEAKTTPSNVTPRAPGTGSKTSRRIRRIRTNGRSKGGMFSFSNLGLWQSRGLLLVVAWMYSTNYASVKYLETLCSEPPCDHDPAEIAFSRFFVSALVCIPILYMNRKNMELIKAGLECGLSVSINYVGQAEALELIPAGKCCFIGTLTVAAVPIFNGIFLGKPIKFMSLVSAGIALIGIAILENLIPIGLSSIVESANAPPAAQTGALIFGIGKGDLLAMGQPIGFGYTVMRIDYYLEKYSHLPNRVLTITAAQCVTVCVTTFLWLLYDNRGAVPDLSYMLESHHLMALGWTGIVTSIGAIVLQGTALQKASATDAALIFCTEPIMASLFAGWLLNETPAASTYVGGAVIIVACVLGSLSDTGDSSGERKGRKTLKAKSSSVEDSLLPTRVDPSYQHPRLKTDSSVPNLTEIEKFPSTTIKTNGKMHSLI